MTLLAFPRFPRLKIPLLVADNQTDEMGGLVISVDLFGKNSAGL
jgi:hypothetical protein